MNIQDFLVLHTSGIINFTGRINVLYNPINDTEGRIEAITMTQNAAGVLPLPDSGVNINSVLEQVETVTLTFNEIQYTFTVIARDFIEGTVPFFFFQVTSDTLVPNIFAQYLEDDQENIAVTLEPFLNNVIFASSDFNVLINNGDNLRKNSNRVVADRESGTIRPSNFTAILEQSASAASLQDSFYTDTGLINARYQGSKTTAVDFAGVPPALGAREFVGEIHPTGVNTDYACGLGNNNRILENLLHTGPGTTPSFILESTGTIVSPDTAQADDLIISYAVNDLNVYRADFEIGDILKIGNEFIRIEEHNPLTKRIKMRRAYLGTTAQVLPSTTTIFRINRVDIFREDEFNSSLSTIADSVVFIQEDNKLVYTDDFGMLFSSSLCPDVLLMGIDNPNSQ